MNDPIADLLTRIRNAAHAKKAICSAPASRLSRRVLDVLVREGFLSGYEMHNVRKGIDVLSIRLRYHNGRPAFDTLERVSKLGRRAYASLRSMPRVNGGLGIAVLSTSKGVLSDGEAFEKGVGGEVLCRIY